MKKLNKQLTVYLSKSLLLPEKEIEPVRTILTGLGFIVTEYKKDNIYDEKLVFNADFVVFITKEKSKMLHSGSWETFVGRGQFDEAIRCSKLKKPAFMIHQMKKDGLLISKLTGDSYKSTTHRIYDGNDWKYSYGIIGSYVMGMSVISLFPFLEGYFGLKEVTEYPLSSEECFKTNNRLLLLLK